MAGTFGNEADGTGSQNLENSVRGTIFTMDNVGNQEAIRISANLASDVDKQVRCALYNADTLALVGETVELDETYTDGVWYDFTFAVRPALIALQDYYIVGFGEGGVGNLGISLSNTAENFDGDAETYNGFPDPLVPLLVLANRSADIHCDYDTIAVGLSIPVAMHHYSHHIGKIIRG